jgi:hypothetical protein
MTIEFIEPFGIIEYDSQRDTQFIKNVRIHEPNFMLHRNRTSSPILSRPSSPNYPEIPIKPTSSIKSKNYSKGILDLYEKYSIKKDYGIEDPFLIEEKGNYNVNSKIDSQNISYVKPISNVTVFDEKVNFNAAPKIESFNKTYSRHGGSVEIFNEKIKINAQPRIIASNENYIRGGGNKVIFDERVKINAEPRIITNNHEYVKKESNKKVELVLIDLNSN